jgi:very-short-patch-repair endonuclease
VVCGRSFIPSPNCLSNPAYKGICCSRQCSAAYRKQRGDFDGANNPAWRGTKIKRTCIECGKEFMAKPSDIKRGYGKYCSKSCRIIHTYRAGKFNTKPNKPERRLIELFKKHDLPFKYVGNGDVWIGNHNPDFININNQKQVIELFGNYWHPTSDVVQWAKHYNRYGFNCLIIWENEMQNIDNVLTKIKKYEGNKTI